MKWIIALVLALASTALAISQIDFESFRSTRYRTPEDARRGELMDERGRLAVELAQLIRLDSLLPLLHIDRRPVVSLHPRLDTAGARTIMTAARSQLTTMGTPKVRVGIFVIDRAYGSEADYFSFSSTQYFTSAERDPYCMSVGLAGQKPGRRIGQKGETDTLAYLPRFSSSEWSRYREGKPPQPDYLGPCALWARFGPPGPRIHQWLNRGGHHFAQARADWLGEAAPNFPWSKSNPERKYWRHYSEAMGCLGGNQDECRDAFLISDQSASRRNPYAFSASLHGRIFGLGDAALLAHLEKEFGAERFERFWRSTQDVEPAFEAAFGVPLAPWLMQWAQKYFGKPPVGSGMHLATVGLSLATILALVGVAVAIGSRRSVG